MVHAVFLATIASMVLIYPSIAVSQQNVKQNPAVPGGGVTSPIINPPPSLPSAPIGPIWMPAQKEQYRLKLEQYRQELEVIREASPDSKLNEYRLGLSQYRNGIEIYRKGAIEKLISSRQ